MSALSLRLTDETLGDIQGIITSAYAHLPLAEYLFVKMTSPVEARRWLESVSASITSSKRWPVGGDGKREKARTAVNVGITAQGLRACGLPDRVLCTFPPEFQEGIASPERSRILGDTDESAPALWEIGGPGTDPVHAVLLVFGANEIELERAGRAQRAILEKFAGGVDELPGSAQRGYRPDTSAEPFGFRDGIAQPSIAGLTEGGVPTGEFILGHENHYGLIPPTPVVPRELDRGAILSRLSNPYHAAQDFGDLGRNGSYLAYRKLQQDVAGFWRFMAAEAARTVGADPAHAVWLASKCVGRWPSGAPLVLAPDRDNPDLGGRDDFLYGGDRDGLACPLGAHVRRTNPRDALEPYASAQSLSMSEAHRLLRRGRVYGVPLFDPGDLQRLSAPSARQMFVEMRDDGRPRGTHFFCVNANLRSQFEFVQQTWCNNPHFNGLNDNTDPLVGNHGGLGETPSRMTIPRPHDPVRTRPLPRFVTVKAGAYFFLPSLTALRFLGAARS